ncbi:hypothetical protein MP228_010928 [Amoeboaphelidium protococcarum]|nr:hypothetical protein MP228_010928 [Amoeboaphelidium protococcarum]
MLMFCCVITLLFVCAHGMNIGMPQYRSLASYRPLYHPSLKAGPSRSTLPDRSRNRLAAAPQAFMDPHSILRRAQYDSNSLLSTAHNKWKDFRRDKSYASEKLYKSMKSQSDPWTLAEDAERLFQYEAVDTFIALLQQSVALSDDDPLPILKQYFGEHVVKLLEQRKAKAILNAFADIEQWRNLLRMEDCIQQVQLIRMQYLLVEELPFVDQISAADQFNIRQSIYQYISNSIALLFNKWLDSQRVSFEETISDRGVSMIVKFLDYAFEMPSLTRDEDYHSFADFVLQEVTSLMVYLLHTGDSLTFQQLRRKLYSGKMGLTLSADNEKSGLRYKWSYNGFIGKPQVFRVDAFNQYHKTIGESPI